MTRLDSIPLAEAFPGHGRSVVADFIARAFSVAPLCGAPPRASRKGGESASVLARINRFPFRTRSSGSFPVLAGSQDRLIGASLLFHGQHDPVQIVQVRSLAGHWRPHEVAFHGVEFGLA